MSLHESEVVSPCINVCRIDDAGLCTGCYRHINEITGWQTKSPKEQKEILLRVLKRQQESN